MVRSVHAIRLQLNNTALTTRTLLFLSTRTSEKVQNKSEAYVAQIKRLKTLLVAAKRDNEALEKKLSSANTLKTENKALKKLTDEHSKMQQKLEELATENSRLQEEYKLAEKNDAERISALENAVDRLEIDLHLAERNNELLGQERLSSRLCLPITPKQKHGQPSPPTAFQSAEFLAEKHRSLLELEKLNSSFQSALTQNNELKAQNDQLRQQNDSLTSELNQTRLQLEQNKEKSKQNLQCLNLEITSLKHQIEVEKNISIRISEPEVSDLNASDFGTLKPAGTATKLGDREEKVVDKSTRSESLLEEILLNTTGSKSCDETIVEELIDAETENNLLKEQIALLKEEIRRLDVENTEITTQVGLRHANEVLLSVKDWIILVY